MSGFEVYSARSLDRVAFFADGVFAIAITLLVVEITIPHVVTGELRHALGHQGWEFFSFALSFAVIGNWWVVHHRTFNNIVRVDERFLWLQLLFLMSIVFLPFPTAVLGRYSDSPTAVILYAGSLTAVGVASALLWIYATHGHRLVPRELDERRIAHLRARSYIVPAVFATSIPVALASTSAAQYWWLLLIPALIVVERVFPDQD